MVTLVLGGAASGKSEYAESLILDIPSESRVYVATMECFDMESRQRVARHRQMRADKHFRTVECPVNLKSVSAQKKDAVLVECISNLVANEIYSPSGSGSAQAVSSVLDGAKHLCATAGNVVFVSNLVFSDGVLYDCSTQEYIKILGQINQELAQLADRVVEVVYTIPLDIKGEKR